MELTGKDYRFIVGAIEEVLRMDELQLIAARKTFDWAYLRQALERLQQYAPGNAPDTGVTDSHCPECNSKLTWCVECEKHVEPIH